ncbi:DNA alkylation repair protein [Parafilimonas sp.]|uniref:DNA alkylation repair protein n=1 Tax=Parafilimonas sp. TaxID=1969739 RepID=UPI0039E67C14
MEIEFKSMNVYLLPLQKLFQQHADAVKAAGAKKYMLNRFVFYGIVMAVCRKLSKDFIKSNSLTSVAEVEKIAKQAWQLPEREWQYFAIELLSHYKNQWTISTIKTIEYCIVHKSWWDTVDAIADACAGEYFKLFPQQVNAVTGAWNASENMWLQRSSLLFQKKYKAKTDTRLLAAYIQHLSSSKEFFIRKAIGWILREYAKTNADWVKHFVETNQHLSALSRREALKHFP